MEFKYRYILSSLSTYQNSVSVKMQDLTWKRFQPSSCCCWRTSAETKPADISNCRSAKIDISVGDFIFVLLSLSRRLSCAVPDEAEVLESQHGLERASVVLRYGARAVGRIEVSVLLKL